eukprot:CAMPEP_0172693444 /NCGR_PEP_ID=MMETSP1074-20121228/25994_1 /TAXON_ID=2916 /ORGANISM="Ceratium fusus, Strain PA161109" /LENGTH=139 /DNA_ID=CAMNT_0013513817 /DNA_START=277 /DNA_END=697 /DNA_ORIENTATION=-
MAKTEPCELALLKSALTLCGVRGDSALAPALPRPMGLPAAAAAEIADWRPPVAACCAACRRCCGEGTSSQDEPSQLCQVLFGVPVPGVAGRALQVLSKKACRRCPFRALVDGFQKTTEAWLRGCPTCHFLYVVEQLHVR